MMPELTDETKEVLNWLAVKQQFFTPIIEAKNGFKTPQVISGYD